MIRLTPLIRYGGCVTYCSLSHFLLTLMIPGETQAVFTGFWKEWDSLWNLEPIGRETKFYFAGSRSYENRYIDKFRKTSQVQTVKMVMDNKNARSIMQIGRCADLNCFHDSTILVERTKSGNRHQRADLLSWVNDGDDWGSELSCSYHWSLCLRL